MTKKNLAINYLLELIADRGLKSGDKIGSESALAKQLNISRTTFREATQDLIMKEMIYRISGSGLFVGEKKRSGQTPYNRLKSFDDNAKEKGMIPRRKVLSIDITKASNSLAAELCIKPGSFVYHVRRLMLFDDTPIILEDFYLPTSMFPNLNFAMLENSKYRYVESVTGKQVFESEQSLTPVIPQDEETCSLLQLEKNQPVLLLHEVTRFNDGTPFEVNKSLLNTEYYGVKNRMLINRNS